MKNFVLFAIAFISLSAQAGNFVWIGAGAAYSNITNMYPSDAHDIKHGSSYFGDIDAGSWPMFLAHYGYKYNLTHSADVNFNGGAAREANFNFSTHELGVKFMLPFEWHEVYIGTGGLWGQARLEDETDTVSGESRALGGYYWHMGYHYMFTKNVGMKFAYQSNHIQTDEMKNLNKRKMSFDQSLFSVGVTIRIKD